MNPTLKDVAKSACVSVATVSRVLNNDPRISESTKIKVLNCVNSLNYRVNNVARSLKTQKTRTIGFICPDFTNQFFMYIAKGIEEEFRKIGYNVILCCSSENIEDEMERIDLLIEKCVDGVIVIPHTSKGNHLSRLKELNIPVVLIDRLVEGFKTDTVLVDNVDGSYNAISLIISRGHKRIGFIGGDMSLTSAKERYEGYKNALQSNNIPLDNSIIKFGDYHIQSGFELMKGIYEATNPPEFVFIANYLMHLGAVKFLFNTGNKKINISLASFDELEYSEVLGYTELLVTQPMAEIGSKAASLLIERINSTDEIEPRIERLKTKIRVKEK